MRLERGRQPRRWYRSAMLLALALFMLAVASTSTSAAAMWTSTTIAGGNGTVAATQVNQGAVPTMSISGRAVTVSWGATTLASGQPATGYTVARYNSTNQAQTMLSACNATTVTTSCIESNVPTGDWTYTVTPRYLVNWVGAESDKGLAVSVDATPPTNAITLSNQTGSAGKTGNTVYYVGAAGGSFTLTNAVTDIRSGPASSTTGSLTGSASGWAHAPSTVSAPAGGPYVSATFTWAAGSAGTVGTTVTGRDASGNTASTTLNVVKDSTPPTSGAISYLNGYQPGRSVSLTFSAGTDSGGSGIGLRQLQRSQAALTAGSCGAFSSFTPIGAANPTSPFSDVTVGNGACYQYRYVVSDVAGNTDTATTSSISRLDYATTVSANPGLLSYWRLGEAAASALSLDSFAGTTGAALTSRSGELAAAWTSYSAVGASQITSGKSLRRSAASTVTAYTSAVPMTANYRVEAEIIPRSILNGDVGGVLGRIDTSNAQGTYYSAVYDVTNGYWALRSTVGGATSLEGTFSQPLTAGQSYRVGLDLQGTIVRLLVDGVERVSVVTSAITGAGRAGLTLSGTSAASDSTTLQLENFEVIPAGYPRAADKTGINTADYHNGVSAGGTGAIGGDPNTGAVFDGVNDYVQAVNTTGLATGANVRSVEIWFKTTSTARQTLFAYGTRAATQEFGLYINAPGTGITAWGLSADTFFNGVVVNNGAWHQAVVVYDGANILIYLDGTFRRSAALTRATTIDQYGFVIGSAPALGDANSLGNFTGSIDDVSFYTIALTGTDVLNHYALGSSTGP